MFCVIVMPEGFSTNYKESNSKRVRFEVSTAVTMKNGVFWGCYAVVALVRTDISEELSAFFIRVTRISEVGTTLATTSNRRVRVWYFFAAYVGC
jgi:hypothetical protein